MQKKSPPGEKQELIILAFPGRDLSHHRVGSSSNSTLNEVDFSSVFIFRIGFEPVEVEGAYLYRQNAAVPSLDVHARYR